LLRFIASHGVKRMAEDLSEMVRGYGERNSDVPVRVKHMLAVVRSLSQSVVDAIEEATAPLRERILKLEQRLDEVEARPLKYVGTYADAAGKSFMPGNCITHLGSLWVCLRATTEPPRFDASSPWQLAAKAGRDGKDARRAA
jgi:hypothetical protein